MTIQHPHSMRNARRLPQTRTRDEHSETDSWLFIECQPFCLLRLLLQPELIPPRLLDTSKGHSKSPLSSPCLLHGLRNCTIHPRLRHATCPTLPILPSPSRPMVPVPTVAVSWKSRSQRSLTVCHLSQKNLSLSTSVSVPNHSRLTAACFRPSLHPSLRPKLRGHEDSPYMG